MFVEICGGIASGKTTLATQLAKVGFVGLFEQFQDNPFWKAFYRNPSETAFETEITFFLQHYHQIKSAYPLGKPFVCDFSRWQDHAYTRITLSQPEQTIFDVVFQEVNRKIGMPVLIIFLKCNAEIELERIKKRGREIESSITLDYLALLNSAIRSELDLIRNHFRILEIDSGLVDFTAGEGELATVQFISQQFEILSTANRVH